MCGEFTGNCFAHLPPGLTHLNMWDLKVHDEAIKNLPRGITYLDLTLAKELTNRCLKYLPPELINLRMGGNYCISVEGHADLPASLRGPNGTFFHKSNNSHPRPDEYRCLKQRMYLQRLLLKYGVGGR